MEIKKTKLRKIGGLWRIQKGLRGIIDLNLFGKKQIIILKNEKKTGNQPDYLMYFDTGEAIEPKKVRIIEEKDTL